MLKKLRKLYKTIFQLKFKARFVDDLPYTLNSGVIYIEGKNGEEDFAKFLCPCGCKESITLSTLSITENSWSIRYNGLFKRNVTLIPSVNRLVGCRSHFFIRSGKVIWCDN